VILEALAVYTWFYRQRRGGVMAVLALVTAEAELLLAVYIASCTGVPDKVMGFRILHIAMIPMSTIWLVMVIQISGHERWLTRPVIALLTGMLTMSWLAVLTNDRFGLYWYDLTWDGEKLRFIRGPFYWFGLFYNYIHIILAFTLSINWVRHSSGLRRWQALSILVAPLFGVWGNILWNLERSFLGLAPTPTGFLLMGLAATWGFSRFRLFSLVSQAQATVTAGIHDGFLIIDDQDYIVEINAVAHKLCSDYSPRLIDGKYQEVFSFWPGFVEFVSGSANKTTESIFQGIGGCNYYRLNVTILFGANRRFLGKAVLMQDITQQKLAQGRMIEQQKAAAVMEEREYLARELHDDLCQVLSYVNMQSQSIIKAATGGQTAATIDGLGRLIDVTSQAYDDVREYIRGVQTVKMAKEGLAVVLSEYVRRIKLEFQTNVRLELSEGFMPNTLGPLSSLELFRIVQEALSNSRKHAAASYVTVNLIVEEAAVRIIIEDNGKGFDPAARWKSTGFGLTSMRERAERIGGSLRIDSSPGKGTRVTVEVPRTLYA
jgi:signal transduction histidine kinase